MDIKPGLLQLFRAYEHDPPDAVHILPRNQLVVVAEIDAEGAFIVFPIDAWGQINWSVRELVFSEEVVQLPLPSIPMDRFPPPYGQGDEGSGIELSRLECPK